MSSTTTYFLEVSGRVSSKVATNGSFRGKRISKMNIFEAIILRKERRSASEVIRVFLVVLEGPYLRSSTIYFLEMNSRVLLKVTTKVLLELKKSWKLSFFRQSF